MKRPKKNRNVGIIGVGQTEYSSHKEDQNQPEMIHEGVRAALKDAGLKIGDVDCVIHGNMELFEMQFQPDLWHSLGTGSHGKQEYRIENYYCVGGNVHFTPNSRRHYDLDSPFAVRATIEHYQLGDGPDGHDLAEPWTCAKFARYRELAPDCMGPWLIYWRQNIPGHGNACKDDEGQPMKNWWPFLFY